MYTVGPQGEFTGFVKVSEFCDQIMRFLKSRGAGLAVIACNTATAATFDNGVNLRTPFTGFPILGTIPFAAKFALKQGSRGIRHIGVIATEGTVSSGAYSRALTAFASRLAVSCIVTSMSCPEFMAIAEAGTVMTEKTKELTRTYMQAANDETLVRVGFEPRRGSIASPSVMPVPMESIIFGCTHYPLLAGACKQVVHDEFGQNHVKFIDPADALVEEMRSFIEPLRDQSPSGWTRYFVNGKTEAFNKRASRVLGEAVMCELVELD